MSDRTPSEPDGTINSDRVAPVVTSDQKLEGAGQDAEDAGTLRVDSDAGDGNGEGSSGAAGPGRHVGP